MSGSVTLPESPLNLQPLHSPIQHLIKEKNRENFLTPDSSSVQLIFFTEHLNMVDTVLNNGRKGEMKSKAPSGASRNS